MPAELVAGEGEELKVGAVGRGFDGLVKFLETFELGGEAAFGGAVNNEDDLAFEVGGRVGLALF